MVNKTATLVACIGELADRYVIGSDPFEVERLAWHIQWAEYGRAGEIAQSTLSAFDVACWDLMGQSLGVPVWKLLGGRFNERVPAYANGWYRVERDPYDQFAAAAHRVTERRLQGAETQSVRHGDLKLTPRGAPPLRSASWEAVRNAVGRDSVEIMIEMHGRFAPHQAIEIARRARALQSELDRGALPARRGCRGAVAGRGARHLDPHRNRRAALLGPLFPRALRAARRGEVVQPDINQCGGLLEEAKIAISTAETHSVMVAPHNVGGIVSTTAALHLMGDAAQRQDPRALQRLHRPVGVRARRPRRRRIDARRLPSRYPTGRVSGSRSNHDACAEHPATGGTDHALRGGVGAPAAMTGGD